MVMIIITWLPQEPGYQHESHPICMEYFMLHVERVNFQMTLDETVFILLSWVTVEK